MPFNKTVLRCLELKGNELTRILLVPLSKAPATIGGEDVYIYEPLAQEYVAAGVSADQFQAGPVITSSECKEFQHLASHHVA
jgi:hypothetical protein